MLYALLKLAHLAALIVWIGGMVFAHFFLRPATASLAPAVRLPFMQAVLQRFFGAVTVAALVVVGSGIWMIGHMARMAAQSGGRFAMPLSWTVMATMGLVMVAIFGHIRFALFKRMQRAVAAKDWAAGGAALASIRTWVFANLCIGIATVAVALLA